jgi:hypothetical protein
MCFRLLAAARPPAPDTLTRAAVEEGLDVRVASTVRTDFVEIAWGDCACSLYSGKRGRERVVAFVERLLQDDALQLQLLLFSDDLPVAWNDEGPLEVSGDAFHAEGLGALPEGRVVVLSRQSGSSRNVGR